MFNNCAGVGRNGSVLNMNRKLIHEFFPPPALRSHANTYRFGLFSTPLLSRRTRPLKGVSSITKEIYVGIKNREHLQNHFKFFKSRKGLDPDQDPVGSVYY